jgi:Tfp pilus assembly protein PilV
MSFLTDAVPFLGPVLGVLGSLFKGKKTQQAPQQTPQQLAAYNQLLQMLMQRNKTGSNSMNQVRNMFYGQQGQQTTQPPIAQATRPRPQVY